MAAVLREAARAAVEAPSSLAAVLGAHFHRLATEEAAPLLEAEEAAPPSVALVEAQHQTSPFLSDSSATSGRLSPLRGSPPR